MHEHCSITSRTIIQESKLKEGSKRYLDPYYIVSTNFRDYYEFHIKLANMGWQIVKIMNYNHGFHWPQQTIVQPLISYKNQINVQVKSTMDFQQKYCKYSMWMQNKFFLNPYEIFQTSIPYWPEIGPRSFTVYPQAACNQMLCCMEIWVESRQKFCLDIIFYC